MLKIFFSLLLLINLQVCSLISMAQIATKKSAITTEQLNSLKATTTVFFYSQSNSASLDSLKQAISSAWDITPLIFDDIRTYGKYASNKKYSLLSIQGYVLSMHMKTIKGSNPHYYLALKFYGGEAA